MSQGKTIVCVDDDKIARYLLEKFVENIGEYHTVGLDSGHACVDYLSQHAVDLLLLDFNLGDMDATEVCEAIAQQSVNPTVPVIVLSVIDRVDIARKLSYPHLLKVVQKPCTMDDIRKDIDRLFVH